MRVRITFCKNEHMRYIGHLDLHRTWERTFRRARLPLAYSQGFNPQPRMNLAAALPLGFTSEGEVGDFWLEQTLSVEEIQKALLPVLPPGLQILSISDAERSEASLQSLVRAADYMITLLDPHPTLAEEVQAILDAPGLPRERRGKSYDLRALIDHLELLPADEVGRTRLFTRLTSLPGATGRPEELLDVLNVPVEAARVHRLSLLFTPSPAA
jgi:radical SAM-linked protein